MNVLTAIELQHTKRLANIIKAHIAKRGVMSFATYMQQALYHPKYGYYTSSKKQFGQHGDFITAPTIGKVFATCLARQLYKIFGEQIILEANILEFGAGTGNLAIDLLLELNYLGITIQNYYLVEVSKPLQLLQKQNIAQSQIKNFTNFVWTNDVPADFNGVIIANELFDAFPVTCFAIRQGACFELGVDYNQARDAFVWREQDMNPHLRNAVSQLNLPQAIMDLPAYRSEINLELLPFFAKLAAKINTAVMIFIDYGFSRQEYYHIDRNTGTLVSHFKHRVAADVLSLSGLQDITAHVDFTHVYNCARAQDFTYLGYTTLANFLIGCGLIEIVSDLAASMLPESRLAMELNLLTSPAEMGELFKVIAFAKGVETQDLALQGFTFKELRLNRFLGEY